MYTEDSIAIDGTIGGGVTIQESYIDVATDCRAGYNLGISGLSTDNTLYLNGDSSYNSDFYAHVSPVDGTNALDNDANRNTWGYYVTNGSTAPTNSSVFLPVPNNLSTPATLRTPFETASLLSDINETVSIFFGINATDALRSGTYRMPASTGNAQSGNLSYNLTASPVCLSEAIVLFDQNSYNEQTQEEDLVENLPTVNDNIYNEDAIVLSTLIPSRTDYVFNSWNTQPDGSGNGYRPGDTIKIGNDSENGEVTGFVTLYAIWEEPVTLEFYGKGLYFDNAGTKEYNTVKYADTCSGITGYVGSNYEEVSLAYGAQEEPLVQHITIEGADRLKVVAEYGVAAYTASMLVIEGHAEQSDQLLPGKVYLENPLENTIATKAYAIDGDTATIALELYDDPEEGYDYGFNIKVYPMYDEPHAGAEEDSFSSCGWRSIEGEYQLPILGNVSFSEWNLDDGATYLKTEPEILFTLTNFGHDYSGQSIHITPIYDAVVVKYEGNGLSFDNDETKYENIVFYAETCNEEYGYVGDNYEEVMSSNISSGGTQENYYSGEYVSQPVTIDGADRLMVVVKYGLYGNNENVMVAEGDWSNGDEPDDYYQVTARQSITGTKTYLIDGDTTTVTIDLYSKGLGPINPNPGGGLISLSTGTNTRTRSTPSSYDYGVYVQVYPIYDEAHDDATYGAYDSCSWQAIEGEYQLPILGNVPYIGWRPRIQDESLFVDESGMITLLNKEGNVYIGEEIYADATYDAVPVFFDGAGLYFDNDETKYENIVFYAETCNEEYGYVGDNYEEVMSSNISTGGIQEDAYLSDDTVQPITIDGADRLLVKVNYGLSANTGRVTIAEGEWDGFGEPNNYYGFSANNDMTGTSSYVISGDTATIGINLFQSSGPIIVDNPPVILKNLRRNAIPSTYDYGVYVQVYPIYDEAREGATYGAYDSCSWQAIHGEYKDPILPAYTTFTAWENWMATIHSESELIRLITGGDYDHDIGIYLYAAHQDPVTFNFNGNGLYFDDERTQRTNTVTYADVCSPLGEAYVGENYEEVMSTNISSGGTQDGSYADENNIEPITIAGADKLKVVVDYGLSAGTGGIVVVEGSPEEDQPKYYRIDSSNGDISGTRTYLIDGDTATIAKYLTEPSSSGPIIIGPGPIETRDVLKNIAAKSSPSSYDYGVYVRIYPVYDEEREGATYQSLGDYCGWRVVEGTYKPVITKESESIFTKWQSDYIDSIGSEIEFMDESELLRNLADDLGQALSGQTINLEADWRQVSEVTVELQEHVGSVGFYNPEYGYQTVVNNNGNGDGTETAHVDLAVGAEYTISTSYDFGYRFNSWSTDDNGNLGDTAASSTTYYINGESTLTATVEYMAPPSTCNTPVPNISYMQEITDDNYATVMSSLTAGQSYYLRDSRDGEPYCVAKLEDGNLWMQDNLRLGDHGTMELTPEDTNITSNWTLPESGSVCFDSSSCTATDGTDDTGFTNAAINEEYKNNIVTSSGNGSGKVGVYYNFCAASAGEICTLSNYDNATQDICPAGWRMPTGGNNGEYDVVYRAYQSNYYNLNAALSVPLSGVFYNSTQSDYNYYGYLWSSNYSSYGDMYSFYLTEYAYVNPSSSEYRYYGMPVRCVAQTPTHSVTVTMDSNISSVTFANSAYGTETATPENPTVTLMSNKPYTITANLTSESYEFIEWSSGANSTISNATENPAVYTAAGDSTLSATSQLIQPPLSCNTPVPNVTYMQEITSANYYSVLNSLTAGQSYFLRDSRDEKPYCVARLEDGSLWMQDNLRLGGDTAMELTPEDTNITSNWTLPESGSSCFSTSYCTYTGGIYGNGYTNAAIDSSDKNVSATSFGNGSGKKGVYYNYCAASAGEICNSSSTANATQDICPAGWRMPIGGPDGEYSTLASAIVGSSETSYSGSDASRIRDALSTPISGYRAGYYTYLSDGYFWSSSNYNSSSIYSLMVNSNVVSPQNSTSYKYYGLPVRCLLKPHLSSTTVNMDSGISSVTFENPIYGTETATPENPTINILDNKPYTITASMASEAYEFQEWSAGQNATLSSSTDNPTTYTVIGDSTLNVVSRELPTYTVTVNLDEHSSSVGFYNEGLGFSHIITNNNNNGDGTHTDTVTLYRGLDYLVSSSFDEGYGFSSWITSQNGTLDHPASAANIYRVNGDASLSLVSAVKTGTATLDTGKNLNAKIKSLAAGGSRTYSSSSSSIKALRMSDNLPLDFVASTANTVSTSESEKPIYIFFDNTDNAGIMYFYTEAKDVYMNQDSSYAFYYNTALSDISGIERWDTSNVTDMSYMFSYTSTNIDALSDWDTGNVTDMRYMFRSVTSLTNIDALSDWDTGNVTNMSGMFQGDSSLIDASGANDWDVNAVNAVLNSSSSFYYMFYGASVHPEFTKRSGSWNTYNTFIPENTTVPSSDAVYVTVSYDEHVHSVEFYNSSYGTQRVRASGNKVRIAKNIEYAISSSYDENYNINYWSTIPTTGTIGDVTNPTTTFTATDTSTLTLQSRQEIEKTVTVNLDSNVESVIFSSPLYESQEVTTSGEEVNLYVDRQYTITAVFAEDYMLESWAVGSNGTVGNATKNPSTYIITDDTTLDVTSTSQAFIVNYHGNGLHYNDDSTNTTNTVEYSITGGDHTYYSHTSNVDDAGVQKGTYPTNARTNQVISIPGASNMHISLTYQTDGEDWEWVSFWEGNHPNYTATNNYDTGVKCGGNTSGKYGSYTKKTIECDISGDSVTFAFKSDNYSYSSQYGYYAVVTASNRSATPISGEYLVPDLASNQIFNGWSTSNDSTLIAYKNEEEMFKDSSLGSYGITNLYAVYGSLTEITINFDEHVESVGIYADGHQPQIIAANGSVVNLYTNTQYIITATYEDGFAIDAWATTSTGAIGDNNWVTTTYEVTGADTLNLTSKQKTGTTTLILGTALNAKMKTLAEGGSTSYSTSSSKIKSIRMSNNLPLDFVASTANTVSTSESEKPIYIFFDNTDNAGIMYFYTEAKDVYMNQDSSYAFYCNDALSDISGVENWNTSNATNMNYMFYGAHALTNIDALSSWTTDNVTNMSYIFSGTWALADIDGVRNWNTSNVTNMESMFSGAFALTNIDALSSWTTDNVKNMSHMFYNATALTNIDALSSWTTSNVTNMSYMFYYATALTNIDALSSWTTDNVTDMESMFSYTSALTDASGADNWDINKVTNFFYMFDGASAPSHPNFTKRLGTWSNGTFTPSSDPIQTITINLGDHTKSVSFTDPTYGTRTITKDGDYIVVPSGVEQTITATPNDDSVFSSWSTTSGTLGSTTDNPTTFITSANATLTVTSQLSP